MSQIFNRNEKKCFQKSNHVLQKHLKRPIQEGYVLSKSTMTISEVIQRSCSFLRDEEGG